MKLFPLFRVISPIAFLAWSLISASADEAPEVAKSEPAAAVPAAANAKPARPAAPKPAEPAAASDSKKKAATASADQGKNEKKTEGDKKEANDSKDKPATPTLHTVKAGEFELKVELDGILEGTQELPVSVNPEEWADLTVLEVVPHGTMVKKGDVLIRFDAEKLEEQISDLKRGNPLAELNLKLAHQELEALERTTPLALDKARRDKMEAEQDLAYYEDVTREMRERDAHEDVKRIEQSLSYTREELNQLEKMYKADDLTEETEEIILQRARNDVAYYEWVLTQTKERSQRTLNTSIPREHDAQRRSVENVSIAWRQAEQGLPDALRKKRLELEAQQMAFEKGVQRLAKLEKDLGTLTVRAPHDGIIYYGASSRGKWITAATVERKLVPGGKLAAQEVFMTLVKATPLQIHVSVPESKLRHLKAGLNGFAWPTWDADSEFKTQLKSISFVPYADGTFDALFSVPKMGEDGPTLYPGMNAKIRLDLYEATNAITVPKKGVHKDAAGHYVHLKDGKKRKVKVGKANEQVYEILEGLKAGDEVKIP